MEASQHSFVKILVAIIALAAIVVGLVYFLRNRDINPLVVDNSVKEDRTTQQEQPTISIVAKHQFDNGEHILAGEASLPTLCHILSTTVDPVSASKNYVTVNFKSSTNAQLCTQIVTQARFKVEFRAPANADIRATWNGAPATINLFPVGENENLRDFELFIKG